MFCGFVLLGLLSICLYALYAVASREVAVAFASSAGEAAGQVLAC